jgi:hypothetical protein
MKAVGLSPGDTSAPTGVEREAGLCYSSPAVIAVSGPNEP